MNEHSLSSLVIVIDAGHGGYDPGARAGSVDEADLNLAVAKKLKKILEASKAEVRMIREEDIDLADEDTTSRKRSDLKKRIEIINQEDVLLFISIHMNTNSHHATHGSEVYYQDNNEYSRQLATLIQNRLKQVTNSKFPVKSGNYYLLNNSKKPGVIVECGFMTNDTDLNNLLQEKYQEDIAFGIYEGIKEFTKILQ